MRIDELTQDEVETVVVELGEAPEQLVVDAHAERGGQAEHVALLVRQVGHAAEEDVSKRVG